MAFRISRPKTAFQHDPSGKEQRRIVDDAHLAFIRKLPSIISGQSPCEACHIRYSDPRYRKAKTALRRKPDDAWAVPMTAKEHRHQHGMNENEFWEQIGIDPLEVALKLYAMTGDVEKATDFILNKIGKAKP